MLFSSDINGSWDLYQQRLDKQEPELLVSGTGFKTDATLSADGKWILYTGTDTSISEIGPDTKKFILRIPAAGGASQVIGATWGFWPFNCSLQFCVYGEPSSDGKQFLFF